MGHQKLFVNFFTDELRSMEEKIKSLAKQIIFLIIDSEIDKISKLYIEAKASAYSGQAYLQELQVDEEIKQKIYYIGYTKATLDMTQLYLEKLSAERAIDKIKTKYKKAVFRELYEKRIMFHKDLADAIGVSPSGLNAVIKQMNTDSVKTINVEEVSKFKLYSLTPVAYQYCSKMEKNESQKKKQLRQEVIKKAQIPMEDKKAENVIYANICASKEPKYSANYSYTLPNYSLHNRSINSEYMTNDFFEPVDLIDRVKLQIIE